MRRNLNSQCPSKPKQIRLQQPLKLLVANTRLRFAFAGRLFHSLRLAAVPKVATGPPDDTSAQVGRTKLQAGDDRRQMTVSGQVSRSGAMQSSQLDQGGYLD